MNPVAPVWQVAIICMLMIMNMHKMWEYRQCVLNLLLFTRPLRHILIQPYTCIWKYVPSMCLCVHARIFLPLSIPLPAATHALPHLPRMGRTTGPHRRGLGSDQQGHEGGWEKSHWHGQVLWSVHLAMYKVGLLPDTWAMAGFWQSMMSLLCPCLCSIG